MPLRVASTRLCTAKVHLVFCGVQTEAVAALLTAPALTEAQLLLAIGKPATTNAFDLRLGSEKNHPPLGELPPAEEQTMHAAREAVDGNDEAEEVLVRYNTDLAPDLSRCQT